MNILKVASLRIYGVLGYEVKFFSEEKSIFLLIDDEDGSILYGVHDTGYF